MARDLKLAHSYSSPLLPSQDMNLAIIYSLCTLYIQYICTYSIIKDLSNSVAYLISNVFEALQNAVLLLVEGVRLGLGVLDEPYSAKPAQRSSHTAARQAT
jgi:hypothetical protein